MRNASSEVIPGKVQYLQLITVQILQNQLFSLHFKPIEIISDNRTEGASTIGSVPKSRDKIEMAEWLPFFECFQGHNE